MISDRVVTKCVPDNPPSYCAISLYLVVPAVGSLLVVLAESRGNAARILNRHNAHDDTYTRTYQIELSTLTEIHTSIGYHIYIYESQTRSLFCSANFRRNHVCVLHIFTTTQLRSATAPLYLVPGMLVVGATSLGR